MPKLPEYQVACQRENRKYNTVWRKVQASTKWTRKLLILITITNHCHWWLWIISTSLSATSQNNYPSINKEAEVDAQLQEYRKKHQRIHKSTNSNHLVEDEDYQATSINIQTATFPDGDLSAIKISRFTQTVTSTENNRFRLKQDNPAKHLTPCPFLRKKVRCLKGSSCDFLHNEKYSHHSTDMRKKEVEYVPPTIRVEDEDY